MLYTFLYHLLGFFVNSFLRRWDIHPCFQDKIIINDSSIKIPLLSFLFFFNVFPRLSFIIPQIF